MHGRVIKVIIETAVLNTDEMLKLCEICTAEKVDFVKTSTGFASRGVSLEDIKFLRENLPASIGLKASGGIRDKDFALSLIAAGADRIGTSSGIEIIKI
jgi:deoxyribose-phosphate aldolase